MRNDEALRREGAAEVGQGRHTHGLSASLPIASHKDAAMRVRREESPCSAVDSYSWPWWG
jgi:hypothetical protein